MCDDDARPWERPGAIRRDRERHRGSELRTLGGVSLLCGVFSIVLGIPAAVGLPLGIGVLIVSSRDLRSIRSGLMDPEGAAQLKDGRRYAVEGIAYSLFGTVVWGSLLLEPVMLHGLRLMALGIGIVYVHVAVAVYRGWRAGK